MKLSHDQDGTNQSEKNDTERANQRKTWSLARQQTELGRFMRGNLFPTELFLTNEKRSLKSELGERQLSLPLFGRFVTSTWYLNGRNFFLLFSSLSFYRLSSLKEMEGLNRPSWQEVKDTFISAIWKDGDIHLYNHFLRRRLWTDSLCYGSWLVFTPTTNMKCRSSLFFNV